MGLVWAMTAGGIARAQGQEAAAPATAPTTVPTTQAAAEEPAGPVKAFYDRVAQGGRTVAVQLLISVAGLAVVIERLVNLRRAHIAPAGLFEQVEALWALGRFDQIRALCRSQPSTLGRMIEAIIEHRHGPPADAATVAADIGTRELKLHLQKAYPIAVVATIEPLLGLFGTVWGMILAFEKVAAIGELGNAAALSSEISLALMTTAVGLAIAIPMLAMHHYFKFRASLFGLALEEQASRLISRHLMRSDTQNGENVKAAGNT